MKIIFPFVIFLVFLGIRSIHLMQHDNCNSTQSNVRMASEIISSPSVYTALQCEDKCFREELCYGFNFKSREKNTEFAICELVRMNSSEVLSKKVGFSFRRLERSTVREKWLMKSCGGCNARQQCSREIEACKKPCKCRKGYLDDGDESCSLVACTDDALLTKGEGNITLPKYIKKQCDDGKSLLDKEFTCYYVLDFNETRNITLKFSQFHLNWGHKDSCSSARQWMELIDNGSVLARVCGNNNNYSNQIVVQKLLLKFSFAHYSDPCVSLIGKYTTQEA